MQSLGPPYWWPYNKIFIAASANSLSVPSTAYWPLLKPLSDPSALPSLPENTASILHANALQWRKPQREKQNLSMMGCAFHYFLISLKLMDFQKVLMTFKRRWLSVWNWGRKRLGWGGKRQPSSEAKDSAFLDGGTWDLPASYNCC